MALVDLFVAHGRKQARHDEKTAPEIIAKLIFVQRSCLVRCLVALLLIKLDRNPLHARVGLVVWEGKRGVPVLVMIGEICNGHLSGHVCSGGWRPQFFVSPHPAKTLVFWSTTRLF